jgi:drug/metabolite transporter (DMT)-like permease
MFNMTSKNKTVIADIGLLYAAAIWGATFVVVKSLLNYIDPVIMVAYRFLFAGSVLLIFLVAQRRPVGKGWGRSLFLGIILWLLYIPQTIGLKYTTASNSGFITGLFVAFIPLFMKVIFRRNPNLMEIMASAVSLSGLWILTGGLSDVNLGDILTLVAAMTYALHVLYSDKYMKMGIDPFVISCQQFLIVGALSLITGLILDLPLNVGTVNAGLVIIFLALFPTLSAFVIQMIAQKITSPLRVSLIFALEPVFAAIFAWTIGGESVVMHRALGGLLIFLALLISGLPAPSFWARKRN